MANSTSTANILAAGMADFILADKAALRARIWFGFGWYTANNDGDAKAFEGELRRAIDPAKGPRKGAASMAVKTAKLVGAAFEGLFSKELATSYESPAHFVQACFLTAMASGATTVDRLNDWAEHGDPEHSAKAKAAAAAEKAAAAAEKAAEAADALNDATHAITPLAFDLVPEAVAAKAERDEMTPARALADTVAAMTDSDLTAWADAIAAELAARAVKANAKAA